MHYGNLCFISFTALCGSDVILSTGVFIYCGSPPGLPLSFREAPGSHNSCILSHPWLHPAPQGTIVWWVDKPACPSHPHPRHHHACEGWGRAQQKQNSLQHTWKSIYLLIFGSTESEPLERWARPWNVFYFEKNRQVYDFPGGSDSKASACNTGDPGSIPGLGWSPGEGNGNPLQYSCLENPMDGGAWWAVVHGVTKSQTRLRDFTFTCPDREMAIYVIKQVLWSVNGRV